MLSLPSPPGSEREEGQAEPNGRVEAYECPLLPGWPRFRGRVQYPDFLQRQAAGGPQQHEGGGGVGAERHSGPREGLELPALAPDEYVDQLANVGLQRRPVRMVGREGPQQVDVRPDHAAKPGGAGEAALVGDQGC
jgi:hypothetical protein